MSTEAYLDHPGDITWYAGAGPREGVTPCMHRCDHYAAKVVAWGPDKQRYTLDECAACGCRAWHTSRSLVTSPWLGSSPETSI